MIGRTDHDVDIRMIIVLLPETEFCEVGSIDVIMVLGHWEEIMTKYGRIYVHCSHPNSTISMLFCHMHSY